MEVILPRCGAFAAAAVCCGGRGCRAVAGWLSGLAAAAQRPRRGGMGAISLRPAACARIHRTRSPLPPPPAPTACQVRLLRLLPAAGRHPVRDRVRLGRLPRVRHHLHRGGVRPGGAGRGRAAGQARQALACSRPRQCPAGAACVVPQLQQSRPRPPSTLHPPPSPPPPASAASSSSPRTACSTAACTRACPTATASTSSPRCAQGAGSHAVVAAERAGSGVTATAVAAALLSGVSGSNSSGGSSSGGDSSGGGRVQAAAAQECATPCSLHPAHQPCTAPPPPALHRPPSSSCCAAGASPTSCTATTGPPPAWPSPTGPSTTTTACGSPKW